MPQTKGDPPIVRDVSFSPDAKLIATANDDGRVRIWDAAAGTLVKEFAVDAAARSPRKVLSVVFSPDGRLLATAGEDSIVRLWRTSDWRIEATLSGHTDEIWQLVFAHGGSLLISASDDRTARIWDVAAHRLAVPPLQHAGPVWSVDVAADGGTIATASSDGSIHLWTLRGEGASVTASHRETLRLSDDPVWVIAFNRHPAGALLAIGGVDRTIRIVRIDRLRSLFDDPKALEDEAMRGSGLKVGDTPDEALMPVALAR
jgi:WD40 repeat protein